MVYSYHLPIRSSVRMFICTSHSVSGTLRQSFWLKVSKMGISLGLPEDFGSVAKMGVGVDI